MAKAAAGPGPCRLALLGSNSVQLHGPTHLRLAESSSATIESFVEGSARCSAHATSTCAPGDNTGAVRVKRAHALVQNGACVAPALAFELPAPCAEGPKASP